MNITANIKWFDELKSTNSTISTDKMSLPSGTVYATVSQTAGKGQRGNSWESAPGKNLTFSILIKCQAGEIESRRQHIISEATTIGIVNYLKDKGIKANIKWPNDIYAGDFKICGILIENSVTGRWLGSSIIGIGININQLKFVSDAPNPISVANITGQRYDIHVELPMLLKCIFDEINCADAMTESRFLDMLYRKGEWHEYIDCIEERRFKGKIVGTDEVFRLIVEKEDGTRKPFSFKEIKYIIS